MAVVERQTNWPSKGGCVLKCCDAPVSGSGDGITFRYKYLSGDCISFRYADKHLSRSHSDIERKPRAFGSLLLPFQVL